MRVGWQGHGGRGRVEVMADEEQEVQFKVAGASNYLTIYS